MKHYKKLETHFGDYIALSQIESLLGWDYSVVMPEKGAEQRARQMAALESKMHEQLTAPEVEEWLSVVDEKQLDDWQKANLRVMRHLYLHASAVPMELASKKVFQERKTEMLWQQARAENDFKMVQDELDVLMSLVKEIASAKAEKMNVSPYDALMDAYAPNIRSADVDVIFNDLAGFLPNFLNQVLEKQKKPEPIEGPFSIETQEHLGKEIAEFLGFDFSRGRLDVSAHPFTAGAGDDVRITSRYNEDEFLSSLQAVVHEAGHAFYDMNAPKDWRYQPVGDTINMGMLLHESQSIGLEMQLGRSLEFMKAIAPYIQKAFQKSTTAWGTDNLHALMTEVTRSFIRVDADEVTYPLHVILRYQIEKDIIEDKFQIKNLPEVWNAKMKDLIGVVPPSDQVGCLQDVHWYSGAVGYFPTYALGAVAAAQFIAKMKCDIPDVFDQAEKGNVQAFTGWLKENVQKHGCLYEPQILIEKVTGQKLSTEAFKEHLTQRYLKKG